MKNIKKFYPLIVGLVLLISVAAYGTRAYFSDSTSEKAGIELKLGHVKIESGSTPWTISEKGTNNKVGKTINEKKETYITNAKPGDSFSKIFTFTNNSSLKTKFKMTQNITSVDKEAKEAKGPFDIKLTVVEQDGHSIPNSVELTKESYSNEDLKTEDQTKEILLDGKEEVKIKLAIIVNDGKDFNRDPISEDAFVLDLLNEMIEVKLIDADGSIAE